MKCPLGELLRYRSRRGPRWPRCDWQMRHASKVEVNCEGSKDQLWHSPRQHDLNLLGSGGRYILVHDPASCRMGWSHSGLDGDIPGIPIARRLMETQRRYTCSARLLTTPIPTWMGWLPVVPTKKGAGLKIYTCPGNLPAKEEHSAGGIMQASHTPREVVQPTCSRSCNAHLLSVMRTTHA